MYRRVLIGGVTAAAILGTGGAALAASGSSGSTAGTPSATSTTARHHGTLLGRALHAQAVTRGKDGGFVTHDLIRGTVTGISATSITVQAADRVTETYAITKDTRIRVRTDGKGAAGSITDIARGDRVGVVGTGSSAFTAQRIVVVKA